MLYRKIERPILEFMTGKRDKVLVIQGARQIGKSFIIRYAAKKTFKNLLEVNLVEDKNGPGIFSGIKSTADFYLRLSMIFGDQMKGNRDDTIVFLDEIQEYPELLTLLKFLNAEARFTYIASGSLLGVTLKSTVSIPVGSLRILDMYPLDFQEFLRANSVGDEVIDYMHSCYRNASSLPEVIHKQLLDLWRKYLLVGGMPDAVNAFIETQNIAEVRDIHHDIIRLYGADASKYDNEHRLLIRRVYEMIPSAMESKKKRVVVKNIEGKTGSRYAQYMEEFEYLICSGIALAVNAVSNPRYPLAESAAKNLLKLYLNDPGLLTSILFGTDAMPVLDDIPSVNLGALYESAVAAQLAANGHKLYYYDNKKKGEVDFLVNQREQQSILPIEVKSGKDYTVHSAISRLVDNPEYAIARGIVLSNSAAIRCENSIDYIPVYYSMFI